MMNVVATGNLRYTDGMPAKLKIRDSLETRVPPKRDRTRATLIRAAFSVYARQGFDAPTIDDFIAEAQVSRGTFYNYFQTREDLMAAVAADLATFITSRIESASGGVRDPLERIAIAARYFVMLAAKNEIRGWVLARMIPIIGGPLTNAMSAHARVTMEAAVAEGRIRLRSISAGIDLGLGMMAMAIRHNLSRRAAPYPPELVCSMMLQAIGASFKDAEEVAYRRLPPLSVDEGEPMAEGGDATEPAADEVPRQKARRRPTRRSAEKRR
ncbi:MAG TPA: TetR/AcrR family transcriptional regulator [Steroidobacteraceae bacterium]|jgi:AcrR family transcriptional regulator|nr:TetR/AcrR family transcriptional regulator [Steroidobacteraceae bacterium]